MDCFGLRDRRIGENLALLRKAGKGRYSSLSECGYHEYTFTVISTPYYFGRDVVVKVISEGQKRAEIAYLDFLYDLSYMGEAA